MIIYCPKCNAGYEINQCLIPQEGRKLRCSSCGDTFVCNPDDLRAEIIRDCPVHKDAFDSFQDETLDQMPEITIEEAIQTPPAPELVISDMQDIFKRLSKQSDSIFKAEQTLPPHKKIWLLLKRGLGLQNKSIRRYFLGMILLILSLLLYHFRFEIVRKMPVMNTLYQAVNIKAHVTGEGLEFQNVTRQDFEDDFVRKMEIKGFIANLTAHEISVPTIHVELLDQNTNLMQTVDEKAPVEKIRVGGRAAFSIVINTPSPLTKYIFLTFVDDK